MIEKRTRNLMPNFLIIGAAKSGTTSLYHYLNQHPDIYFSVMKEPKFFCFYNEECNWQGPGDQEAFQGYVTDIGKYHSLFESAKHEVAIGEATPWYICSKAAAENIKTMIPNVKIIAILRNPVDRAYSHFLHLLREGRETLDNFQDALNAEEARVKKGWGWTWQYKSRGLYYSQLKSYYQLFPKENIRIYLFDDFEKSPSLIIKDIFSFLSVDDKFSTNVSQRQNKAYIPRSRKIKTLIDSRDYKNTLFSKTKISQLVFKKAGNWIEKMNSRNIPPISSDIKTQLIEYYKDDILCLGPLISKDLSTWLT